MAAPRESQGLQIAVIIFAVLTIILAVTTYIFYAQSEDNLTKKSDAEATTRTAKADADKMRYRAQVLQHVIGIGGVDRASVNVPPAGVVDDVAAGVLKKFDEDMAMYGGQVAEGGALNYVVLPNYLLGIITNKQVLSVDAGEETKRVQSKSDGDLKAEQGRTKVAEDASVKSSADLGAQTDIFNKDRDVAVKEKERVASQLVGKDQTIKKEREDADKRFAMLSADLTKLQQTTDTMRKKVIDLNNATVNRFEAPDGRVTLINQAQRLVWVNVGQKDDLQRQTTFAVFDHDENGVAQATPKGRIEVVRIVGDHLAECRILEDKAANPILQNDIIFSPAWTPGVKIHFALVGFMDIDRDGVSDREKIRNVIQMSGGVIDAELQDDGARTGTLSINTRYLVLGEKPTEKSGTRMLQEYNFLLGEVNKFGTETINVQKLMAMMGYKPEERTVELGTNAAKSEFKKRAPPKGAPAAGAAGLDPAGAPPATVPVPMGAAPAAPVDDPFK